MKLLHAAALGGLLALTGCSSVPLTSLVQLSRVDFMTTDFNQLRVAMILPAAIRPRPAGVQMEAKVKLGEQPEDSAVIILQETTASADMIGLPAEQAGGSKTYVYRLAPPEAAKLETIRRRVLIAQSQKQKGSLGIGISAKEFCLNAALANGPILSTTYLSSAETRGYVVVTRDIDLRGDATLNASLDHLESCRK